jgi:hypothetical protein
MPLLLVCSLSYTSIGTSRARSGSQPSPLAALLTAHEQLRYHPSSHRHRSQRLAHACRAIANTSPSAFNAAPPPPPGGTRVGEVAHGAPPPPPHPLCPLVAPAAKAASHNTSSTC